MKRGLYLSATAVIVAGLLGGPSRADPVSIGTLGGQPPGWSFPGGSNGLDLLIKSLAPIVGDVTRENVAITSQGALYGTSRRGFFALDLKTSDLTRGLGNALKFLNRSTPPLQLVLDKEEKGLFGRDGRSGAWYKVKFNGSYAPTPGPPPDHPGNGTGGGVAAVPEPATFVLFGLGGLGLVAGARFRRGR